MLEISILDQITRKEEMNEHRPFPVPKCFSLFRPRQTGVNKNTLSEENILSHLINIQMF